MSLASLLSRVSIVRPCTVFNQQNPAFQGSCPSAATGLTMQLALACTCRVMSQRLATNASLATMALQNRAGAWVLPTGNASSDCYDDVALPPSVAGDSWSGVMLAASSEWPHQSCDGRSALPTSRPPASPLFTWRWHPCVSSGLPTCSLCF